MNAFEARVKTSESIPPTPEDLLRDIHTGIRYACERGDSDWIWITTKNLPDPLIQSVLSMLRNEGYETEEIPLVKWFRILW